MANRKTELPTKICASCHRPFTWRKKWERDWHRVEYCSDKCRAAGRKTTAKPGTTAAV